MSIAASRMTVGVAVVAILVALFWYMKSDTNNANITSFEECVQAGYQITATLPKQCATPDGKIFINTISAVATTTVTSVATSTEGMVSYPGDNSDQIRLVNISAKEILTSPLLVKGEARGNWYFEASFPVEILDGNGKRIVAAPARALGDWMTTEFVPFSVTLTFTKPTTATGTLKLRNDNPSGLPGNDRWISIPVRF